MSALSFPSLATLSQNPEDQESLARIKTVWDEYSPGWDIETKTIILTRLNDVRVTPSNRWKPYSHKLRKADFNFGIWVLLRCIYPTLRLQNLKTRLLEKYPWVDVESFVGLVVSKPEGDETESAAHRNGMAEFAKWWQQSIGNTGENVASEGSGRGIKGESDLDTAFTQPHHSDRYQDLSFNSLRPIQSMFIPRQHVAQHAAAPQVPAPPSDSFTNFLKRKRDDHVPSTPSKKPAAQTAPFPSSVTLGSRSSFLDDDEPETQTLNNAQKRRPGATLNRPNNYPLPGGFPEQQHHRPGETQTEWPNLFWERTAAMHAKTMERVLDNADTTVKQWTQRWDLHMERMLAPVEEQQRSRGNKEHQTSSDVAREVFEMLNSRITAIEQYLRLR
ncbi:hypothetical protein ACHAPT_005719 [Fusarium lateritium]